MNRGAIEEDQCLTKYCLRWMCVTFQRPDDAIFYLSCAFFSCGCLCSVSRGAVGRSLGVSFVVVLTFFLLIIIIEASSTMRTLSGARCTDTMLYTLRRKIGTCSRTTSARERSHCLNTPQVSCGVFIFYYVLASYSFVYK